MLPLHSCGGTLQSLYLKLLYNSTQTSADGLSGQRQVSSMTDEKVRSRPESLVADCSIPALQLCKGAVAEGSSTSRQHPQCRGVSRAETATISDVGRCCAMYTMHNGTICHYL